MRDIFSRSLALSLSLSALLLAASPAHATTVDAAPETRNSPAIAVPERVKLSAFSGTASYAYKFDLPPGTGGLTPALVLTHSTETKSTEYGYGWKLNLGWIERCTRFQAPFYTSPVTTGASQDVFELDGDLLVRDGTTNEFRLRHSDGSLVRYDANTNTWEKIAPDGTRFVYGSTTDSRIYRSTTSANETFRWSLSEVIDPRGNGYRITYDADLDTTTPTKPGAITYTTYVYPDTLEYGFHDGQAVGPQRRVLFEWGPRGYAGEVGPTAACDGREDCPTSYRAGFKVQQRRRLTGVDVEIEEGSSFELVRRYELLYAPKTDLDDPMTQEDEAENPPYSRLDAIQRYGRATPTFPQGEPFPTATTFGYREATRGFSTPAMDWNADEFEIRVERDGPKPGLVSQHESEETTAAMVIDFDADGLPDRLRVENGIWQVAYGTPTGFEVGSTGDLAWNSVLWVCSTGQQAHANGCGNTSFALLYGHTFGLMGGFQRAEDLVDMDGDGRPDRVSFNPADPRGSLIVRLNRGGTFEAPEEWEFGAGAALSAYKLAPVSSSSHSTWAYGTEVHNLLSDLNGDGRPDMLAVSDQKAFINQVEAFDDATPTLMEVAQLSQTEFRGDGVYARTDYTLTDVNGDGLQDFIRHGFCLGDGSWMRFHLGFTPGQGVLWQDESQGSGHASALGNCSSEDPGPGGWPGLYAEVRADIHAGDKAVVLRTLLDLNGDGVRDYVVSVDAPTGGFEVYFGLGDGRFLMTAATGGPDDLPAGVRWNMTGIPPHGSYGNPFVGFAQYYPHLIHQGVGSNQEVRTFDLNGDGLPDYVDTLDRVYLHPGPTGLLETVTNEIGGATTIDYAPSTHFPLREDPELDAFIDVWSEGTQKETLPPEIVPDPRPRWVVSRVVVTDGRDPASDEVQDLQYAGFRFDAERRESFGARVAESADAEDLFTRSVFHQAPALRGKRQYAQKCDTAECYWREETTWEDAYDGDPNRLAGTHLARPTFTQTDLCDDNATVPDCMGLSQEHRVERDFDPVYGNLTLERDCGADGDCTATADNLIRTLSYAASPAGDWMVSYVVEESTYFQDESVASNLVSRMRLHYDSTQRTPGSPTGPKRCTPSAGQPCGGLVHFRETLREIGSPDTWAYEKWSYDAYGNLATYHDPVATDKSAAATQTATWDAAGAFPLSIQNALGHTSHFRFDEGLGEVTKALAPNGYLQCWGYDAFGRLTSRGEHSVALDPPPAGWETTACDTDLASFAFEQIGDPAQQRIVATLEAGTDLDAVRSLRFFDGLGREYQTESESHSESFDVVTRAWGPRGELVCETLPYRRLGGVSMAMPGVCEDALHSHRLLDYDPLLRPTDVALVGMGTSAVPELTVEYGVNTFGGAALDPGLGDLFVERREIHADFTMGSTPNRVQYVGRNARGEVVFLREGIAVTQTTVIERDPKGRIAAVDGPDVTLVGGASDAHRIEIAYNAVDQRTRLVQPMVAQGAGPTWQWDYDLNGDLFQQTSPRGIGIQFHHDALRRLVLKDYQTFTTPANPDPGDFVLTYHASGPGKGQLESVVAPRSGIYEEFGYDLRGRPATKLRDYGGSQYAFAYEFDLLDRPLVAMLPDGGTITYSHGGGVLESVSSFLSGSDDPDIQVSEVQHHPSGGVEHLRFESLHASVAPMAPTHVEGHYTYHPSDHRLQTAMTMVGGMSGLLQDLMYEFDRAGNLRTATDLASGLDQRFEYDALHRLAHADATGGAHPYGLRTYTYDPAGNLLQKGPATGPGRLLLHYDRAGGGPVNVAAVDQSNGSGGWTPAATYTQNQSGAIKKFTKFGASTTLWRDADDRIQSVAVGGKAYSHYYDVAGQRVGKVQSVFGVILQAQRYVDAMFEVDAVAGTHEVHLFVGARRVATSKRPGLGTGSPLTTAADAVEYYHPDHVGSNTLVTNAAGDVVQETYTTPFGELYALVDGNGQPVTPQDSTTPYLFTDQEHDAETGLHYFGARYQDPWIGRFLSQDPELIGPMPGVTFGRLEGDGQHVNAYSYSRNRPTVLIDPTGRFEIGITFERGSREGGGGGSDNLGGLGGPRLNPWGWDTPIGPTHVAEVFPSRGAGQRATAPRRERERDEEASQRTPIEGIEARGVEVAAGPAALCLPAPQVCVGGVIELGTIIAYGVYGGLRTEQAEGPIVRVDPETGEITFEDPLEGTTKETLDRGPLSQQVPAGPQSPIGPGPEPPPGNLRQRIKQAIKNIFELLNNELGG